jgi:hypothetical protein
MNSFLLSEVANLKNTLGPTLESQLKQHAFEISTLNQRYQQLYSFASSYLYSTQSAGTNSHDHFSLNSFKAAKPIAAF